MSKFTCKCGHVFLLSKGWANEEWALILEKKLEKIGERLESDAGISIEEFYEAVDEGHVTVYRCPVCSRMHVDQGDGIFVSYLRED